MEVMLAQRVQLDVLDDDHLIVVGGEQRAIDDVFNALLIAMTQVLHRFGGTFGRIEQAFAVGVFTQAHEDLTVMLWQR